MPDKNYTPIDDLITKYKKEKVLSDSFSKEKEPFLINNEPLAIHEVVEHKEVHKDVKGHIEVKEENPPLPEDLKKVGVETVETTQFPTLKKIDLPLSDEKILAGLHQPITSSFRWLATLALYMLKQAHFSLKVVHGKVMRVQQR